MEHQDSTILTGVKASLQTIGWSEESGNLLCAVSGGIDSMVMLHAMQQAGCSMLVAHCNFKLRGAESDADEQFMVDYCKHNEISFISKSFDTLAYCRQQGLSIQLAARELRYQWFSELCAENAIETIAIAHNQDDSVETFFINLSRGTGLRGLDGIPHQNQLVIRPLISASRAQIRDYALQNDISWREDSSNSKDAYLRNRIRHKLVPVFREVSENSGKGILKTMEILGATSLLMEAFLNDWRKRHFRSVSSGIAFPLAELLAFAQPQELLAELLLAYGIPASLSAKVLEAAKSNESKTFFGPSHCLTTSRGIISVSPSTDPGSHPVYYLEEGVRELELPFKCIAEVHTNNPAFAPDKDLHKAFLDLDTLVFPLEIRRWQQGDHFRPLGMKQFKKVSDFFIDEGFSKWDKENCWILLSEGQIVWIAGRRIDDRNKITKSTRNILFLSLL